MPKGSAFGAGEASGCARPKAALAAGHQPGVRFPSPRLCRERGGHCEASRVRLRPSPRAAASGLALDPAPTLSGCWNGEGVKGSWNTAGSAATEDMPRKPLDAFATTQCFRAGVGLGFQPHPLTLRRAVGFGATPQGLVVSNDCRRRHFREGEPVRGRAKPATAQPLPVKDFKI